MTNKEKSSLLFVLLAYKEEELNETTSNIVMVKLDKKKSSWLSGVLIRFKEELFILMGKEVGLQLINW